MFGTIRISAFKTSFANLSSTHKCNFRRDVKDKIKLKQESGKTLPVRV